VRIRAPGALPLNAVFCGPSLTEGSSRGHSRMEPVGGDGPRPSEVAAFQSLKRRRRWLWGLLLTYLPGAGGLAALSLRYGVPRKYEMVAPIAWMIAMSIAGIRHGYFRCPRCGKRCFQRGFFHNAWASRCLHCNMRLYWSGQELVSVSKGLPFPPPGERPMAAEQPDAAGGASRRPRW